MQVRPSDIQRSKATIHTEKSLHRIDALETHFFRDDFRSTKDVPNPVTVTNFSAFYAVFLRIYKALFSIPRSVYTSDLDSLNIHNI